VHIRAPTWGGGGAAWVTLWRMVLAPGTVSPSLDRPSSARGEPGGGLVLAVAGAVGGAGASSLAVALAVAARDGAALVDLAGGGGIDVLLGLEGAEGARWPDLADARGDVDPDLLVSSLPHRRGVSVLSADRRRPGPPDGGVVADVLRALGRRRRTVVVDAGRNEVPDAATHVVLVVPLTVPGLAGALAWRAARTGAPAAATEPVELVVTCGPAPGRLAPDDVATALGVPVAAHVGRIRGARAAVERGDGPPVGHGTALRRAAARVLDAAAARTAGPGAAGGWAATGRRAARAGR